MLLVKARRLKLGQSAGATVGRHESYLSGGNILALAPEQVYVETRFRESRDERGGLTYLSGEARRKTIAGMPVYDVERDAVVALGAE